MYATPKSSSAQPCRPPTLIAPGFVSAGGELSPTPSANQHTTPVESIKFENINPAIRMGAAWGDRSKGKHGTFGKFPAEFITPFHTHSGAYHGVVLKGVMTNPFEGEQNPPNIGPGSYWYVPANAVHATACVSATPCEFYFHAEAAFDFNPHE